ncbi:MAG TPA: hypothetical protein VGJ32_04250 [Solirubrobacteraceae bacterium]|jgi:hypothetical protein
MKLRIHLAAVAGACAALALPAVAAAEGTTGSFILGLQVTSVDTSAGTATGVMHCVDPSRAGHEATFPVAPGVDVSVLAPGSLVGIRIDGGRIAEARPTPPCDVKLAPAPLPGQPLGDGPALAGPAAPSAPAGHPGDGAPRLAAGFLNRVWRFAGSADSFEDGKLGMTLEKVLNVPKRFAAQDDDLLDEDAIVLVGKSTKVFDKSGDRVPASALADADDVRVQGKLLPPRKWQTDEDDQPVTTIRAKRVTIVR